MGNRALSLDTASTKFETVLGMPVFGSKSSVRDAPNGRYDSVRDPKGGGEGSAQSMATSSSVYEGGSSAATSHHYPLSSGNTISGDSLRMNDLLSMEDNNGDFGWFEEIETPSRPLTSRREGQGPSPLNRTLSLPAPVSAPPIYVLESSLETQQLWYNTAGRRPRQPSDERKEFERIWRENFKKSEVNYTVSLDDIADPSPSDTAPQFAKNRARSSPETEEHSALSPLAKLAFFSRKPKPDRNRRKVDILPRSEVGGDILYRGKSPFSNSVSKSFVDDDIACLTLQMPYYRIVQTPQREAYAEFMIVVTVGGGSNVTFGIWKRHSEFAQFACHIAEINTFSPRAQGCFKNSLLSWECVLHRKRWFKSLDKEYLMLKCFLLERFMHDVLFEAPSSEVIANFLGL